MNRCFLLSMAAARARTGPSAAAAEAPDSYAADLGRVYGGYQRMLAVKEGGETAGPATPARTRHAVGACRRGWRVRARTSPRSIRPSWRPYASANRDMFLALVGAAASQLLLSRVHDRQIQALRG